MKFTKEFYAVEPGEIYPKMFAVGDDCPEELEESAAEQGAIKKVKEKEEEKEDHHKKSQK